MINLNAQVAVAYSNDGCATKKPIAVTVPMKIPSSAVSTINFTLYTLFQFKAFATPNNESNPKHDSTKKKVFNFLI